MNRRCPTPSCFTHGYFLNNRLCSTTFVFLGFDSVRKPQTPPYQGPFKMISRVDKFLSSTRAAKLIPLTNWNPPILTLLVPPLHLHRLTRILRRHTRVTFQALETVNRDANCLPFAIRQSSSKSSGPSRRQLRNSVLFKDVFQWIQWSSPFAPFLITIFSS